MVLVLSGLGRGMSGEDNEVSLRVAKAIPSDVGHGRARISGEHGLDLKPGDIVEIKGEKRSTAAIYWRSRPEDSKWTSFESMVSFERTLVSVWAIESPFPRLRQKECTKAHAFPSYGQQAEGQVRSQELKALPDVAFPSGL